MALIGRIFVILFAIFVAMFAAGVALALGILGPQWHVLSGDIGERVAFWSVAMFASGVTATIAFVPLLLTIVLAEGFSIRSLLVYVAVGAAVLLLAYYGAGLGQTIGEPIDNPPPLVGRETELTAVAGMVFGFVYWAIAGRAAGRWRGRPDLPSA
jgi:hypothetical protein